VRASAAHGSRGALVIGDRRVSFDELLDRAREAARGLASLGIGRGSRVAAFMPNCEELVEILFAMAMLGAVAIPVNSRFRLRELLHIARDARPAMFVTLATAAEHSDHVERLAKMASELPSQERPLLVALGDDSERAEAHGMLTGAQLAAAGVQVSDSTLEDARARVRVRDLAAILYTSGTTAAPKGCLHTHEALVRNAIVTGRTRFLLGPEDRFWDPLPMFHVSFLTPLLACVDAGAQMLAMDRFEPESALDLIERERATWVFAAFKAIAGPLIAAESFPRRSLSSVRMTMLVGLEPELRAFQAAFGSAQLLSTYGSTETGGVITYHEPDASDEQRVSTCGTAFRGVELAIGALESEGLAAPDTVGEILVRGYSVLDGYLNDPDATAAALDADGWLHTGDLGRLDADGQLRFEGRLKDMIKVGGENVSPAEVEALLAEHPAIVCAYVVAAPDPRLDEVVAAFAQLAPGTTASADELIAFCAENLARYKVPRHVRFVDGWPMSATKVRKDVLRDTIAAELAGDAAPAGIVSR